MEKRELVCICCPLGCRITVEMEADKVYSIRGNTCKRGEEYAKKEVTNPTRIVTSTVKVMDGEYKTLPVKTKEAIPKEAIFACVKALKEIEVKAPIAIGDVILANAADTGVDIIAAKNMKKI